MAVLYLSLINISVRPPEFLCGFITNASNPNEALQKAMDAGVRRDVEIDVSLIEVDRVPPAEYFDRLLSKVDLLEMGARMGDTGMRDGYGDPIDTSTWRQ